jgi:hypothetical protein
MQWMLACGAVSLTRPLATRCPRSGLAGMDLRPMSLGLSHSLSRYKLKFSPEKVDTMIVQVRRGVAAMVDGHRGVSFGGLGSSIAAAQSLAPSAFN